MCKRGSLINPNCLVQLNKNLVLGLVKTLEHKVLANSTRAKNTLSCLKGVIKEAYDLDMIETRIIIEY